MTRVAITGMGCISAFGLGTEPFADGLRSGRSALGSLEEGRLADLKTNTAGVVDRAAVAEHFSRNELRQMDPFSQYAVLCAREALSDAGLQRDDVAGGETGVIVGTGTGGATSHDEASFVAYRMQRENAINPLTIPRFMPGAAGSHIAIDNGATGPNLTVSTACASGSQAIGLGLHLVRSGALRRAIVGGSEAAVTYSVIRCWERLRVLTPDLCRPFSRNRNGIVIGDAAAMFVLEREEDVTARGTAVRAWLSGYGTSTDARDLLAPDVDGCTRAMKHALADAGIAPAAIDHINAHGTGTLANDRTEAAAIERVFGERARSIPVTSTKPIHGHALGAAGAIELAAAILAMRDGVLPATLHHDPDPAIDLDVVSRPRRRQVSAVLSNSFAFGGINASLVVTRSA